MVLSVSTVNRLLCCVLHAVYYAKDDISYREDKDGSRRVSKVSRNQLRLTEYPNTLSNKTVKIMDNIKIKQS